MSLLWERNLNTGDLRGQEGDRHYHIYPAGRAGFDLVHVTGRLPNTHHNLGWYHHEDEAQEAAANHNEDFNAWKRIHGVD